MEIPLYTQKDIGAEISELKANQQNKVILKANCYSQCRYQLVNGKCIYLVTSFTENGEDYIICNEAKKQEDEAYVSQRSQENHHFSLDIRKQQEDNKYQKAQTKEAENIAFVKKEPTHDEPILFTHDSPFSDALSFYDTIEKYYEQLQASNSYETENGVMADTVKYDKIDNKILLLYKEPKISRTYLPYRIAIISIIDGELNKNRVAVFDEKGKALKNYLERLNAMRSSTLKK